jgi:DNA repair protein RecO (recombination protein O)
MKFNDLGFIISIKNYAEKSAIVKIISQENGICRAFVKSSKSKSNNAILQIGNLVSFTYSTRLEENLGSFSHLDLINCNSINFMFNKINLDCVQSIFSIIDELFLERDPCQILFNNIDDFLTFLNNDQQDTNKVIAKYIKLELSILQILGYGIDLSSCVVSNSRVNLAYISPKSARAVSLESGLPYANKLLKLPQFLLSDNDELNPQNLLLNSASQSPNNSELSNNFDNIFLSQSLLDGLELSEFFFKKYLLTDRFNSKLFFRNNLKKSLLKKINS